MALANVPAAAPSAGSRTSLQRSAAAAGRTRPLDLTGPGQRTSLAVAYTPAPAASGVIPENSLGDPYDVVAGAVAAAAVVVDVAGAVAVVVLVAAAAVDVRMVSAVGRHFVAAAAGRLKSRMLEGPLPHYFLLGLPPAWRGSPPPLVVRYRSGSRTYPTLRVQKLCLSVATSAACSLLRVSMPAWSIQ